MARTIRVTFVAIAIGSSIATSGYAQSFEVQPSVTSSSLGRATRTLELGVSCWNAQGIIPNCNLVITHRPIPLSGGHEHDDPNRPKGSFSPSSVNTGPTGRVKVVYTAPEPGGIIEVTLSGTTAQGVPVEPAVFTIVVQIPGLVQLPSSGTGYATTTSSFHNGHNRYGTALVIARLEQIVAEFRAELGDQNVAEADIPTLTWTSLSLPRGGIFDVDADGDGSIDNLWLPPHRSHRFGLDADLRIRNIPRRYRDELDEIITSAGFFFSMTSESPDNPTASHWHIRRD